MRGSSGDEVESLTLKKQYFSMILKLSVLILPIPCISESSIEIKIKLNFYFHTSLWCLKRFYEGL